MAIAFSCSCGKAMKAKDAYAGRKIKCPQCDSVVTIPLTTPDEDDLAITPSPSEPAAPSVAPPVSQPSLAWTGDSAEAMERPPPPLAKRRSPMDAGAEQKAEPAARPASEPGPAPVDAWVDQSLGQRPTPWLPGDEARFQRGIKTPREGMSGLEKSVVGLLVLAGAAAARAWLKTR